MSRATRCLSLLVVLAGCGGPGSFEGTVNGLTLSVKDSVFFVTKNAGQIVAVGVFMSDQPGLCDKMKAGQGFKNSTLFFASMGEGDSTTGLNVTPTAGSYPIWNGSTSPTGKISIVGLVKTDANCQGTTSALSSGGTVTLNGYKAEAGGSMTGSFDATFSPSGDKGKGSFDADFCEMTGGSSITCS